MDVADDTADGRVSERQRTYAFSPRRAPLRATMHRASEGALGRAGRVTGSAQQRPPKRKSSSTGGKSLQEKLYDLYVEERGREPEAAEELTRNEHLLEKLVKRESLPYLVVNLLPGEKEYSLVLRVETKVYLETVLLPYEERDFLQYLDAEELSPDLVDVLEKSQVSVFQSGCVIAEVRDYRRCTSTDRSGYQSRHVLLRPAVQTPAPAVPSTTSDAQKWAREDWLSLENQPILAPAEPPGRDPSVSVSGIEKELLCNQEKVDAPPMKRSLRDCSAASPSPQPEVPCSPRPPEPRARAPDQKREESPADQLGDLGIFQEGNLFPLCKHLPLGLEPPSDSDVEKYAAEDWPFKYDDGLSIVWPDLEAKDGSRFRCAARSLPQPSKLAVMQSLNDPFISGQRPRAEQRPCEKAKRGRRKSHLPSYISDHSYSCMSGSKPGAGKAARQPKKLVTKRDKCPVRAPRGPRGSASLSQLCPERAAEQPQAVSIPRISDLCPERAAEQPQAVSIPAAAQGKESQQPPPAPSLPCSSGKSSSDKPPPAQQPIRVRALPSPAAAQQPPRLPKKSYVRLNRVRTLPAATVSSASASHITPFIQVKGTGVDSKVIQLLGPVRIVRTVVRGSNPAQASSRGAGAPSGGKPSSLPSGGQPQSTGPAAPQAAASQGGVQYVLGNMSSLRPMSVLWIPQDSDAPSILQQAQRPQQLLCHVVAQPPPAQPPAPCLKQPAVQASKPKGPSGPPKRPPAQWSTHWPARPAGTNLSGAGGGLQAQPAPPRQPGSVQTTPEQSRAQRLVPLPSASQQRPQSQLVQGQVVPPSEAAGSASVPPAQPRGGQQPAGQAKRKGKEGPPSTPKC